MNPLGVISMVYARPFTAEHLPLFGRIKAAGLDFVELLVPEPGELPLAEARAAQRHLEGRGHFGKVVLMS